VDENNKVIEFIWKLFGVILLLGIIYVISMPITYYFSIKQAVKDDFREGCEIQKLEHFEGTIQKIDRYEYNDFMNETTFSLTIKVDKPKDTIVKYQFQREFHEEFLKAVRTGDTITKRKNYARFSLGKNIKTKYLMPDCGAIEHL
jgi:hypothetical protein